MQSTSLVSIQMLRQNFNQLLNHAFPFRLITGNGSEPGGYEGIVKFPNLG
jgi:hypothetical protein